MRLKNPLTSTGFLVDADSIARKGKWFRKKNSWVRARVAPELEPRV